MSTPRRRFPAIALSIAALLALVGCSAADEAADSAIGAGPVAGGNAVATETDAVDPAVVITGSIRVRVDDPVVAADAASTIVEQADGAISGRQEFVADEGGSSSAELTLRIPADRVDEVRDALRELGTILETSLVSTDVSAAQRDLTARISTLRASITRFTEWLGTASKTSDLIELESEIATRQSELEALEAEQRTLADQVSLSTITLLLTEEHSAPTTEPSDFGHALTLGWTGFLGFWTGLGLVLATALPWLVLLGAIAGTTAWLMRRRARRKAS
ncbi:DUF4349 domain-containing protein [Microbacterium sp. NPDC055903]